MRRRMTSKTIMRTNAMMSTGRIETMSMLFMGYLYLFGVPSSGGSINSEEFRLKAILLTDARRLDLSWKEIIFIDRRLAPLPVRDARRRGCASKQNLRLSFLSGKRVPKTLRQIKRAAQLPKYQPAYLPATA